MQMGKAVLFLTLLALAASGRAAEVDNPYGEQSLIAQRRASREHDRVTIIIDVTSEAKHEATTETSKETTLTWAFNKLFKITKDRDGDVIAQAFPDARKPELDMSTSREHEGEGETEQTNRTKAVVSGEVIDVRPNGHLIIEARREITVNHEKQVVLFSGRVDPQDLSANNSVEVMYIMEPSIKFVGKGAVSSAVRRGWLARAFDKLSPF